MEKAFLDFARRYAPLVFALIVILALSKLEQPEVRTFLLASLLECFAIAFSSFASYVFTKVRFTEQPNAPNLGLIFLGVHICFGLSVMALYLAQFVN